MWVKEKEILEFYSFVYLFGLPVWKEKNHIVFKDGTLDVQRLKYSFVYNLWSWNRVYLGEETSSLVGFLDWLASN